MATAAAALQKEAREEGLAQGMAQGRSETLILFLEHRFGPLPDDARTRIAEAGVEKLGRWVEKVSDAASLDAVFASNAEH